VLFGFTFKKALFSAFRGFNSFKIIYKLYFLFQSVKISFSVGTVSERWQKNGSFGFLSVGSCVGKNQMCHFAGWLFFVCLFVNFCTVVCSLGLQLTVLGLAFVRDFRAQNCQPCTKFDLKN
ncbi:MAG: hypothetical protein KGZ81_05720, partial [Flavobacteriales bacterium]|nr:hypothetical protein [Flavobacteriales bacterium]